MMPARLLLLSVALCLTASHAMHHTHHCPRYHAKIIRATAADTAGLTPHVDRYRALLGAPNNRNAPGPLAAGHRSINWDAPIVPFHMPADFFKATVPRGITFQTRGGKFAVSNPPTDSGIKDDRFSSIFRAGPHKFVRFSQERLFSAPKSTHVAAHFFVPGSDTRATVSGFGAVFTNVAWAKSSSIALRDRNGCLIAHVAMPPRKNGLSFVGIKVLTRNGKKVDAAVYRAVMKAGTVPLGQAKWRKGNFVAIDDLIYGEPQGPPKPSPKPVPTCSVKLCAMYGSKAVCRFRIFSKMGWRYTHSTCGKWSWTAMKKRMCKNAWTACKKRCGPVRMGAAAAGKTCYCRRCWATVRSCWTNFAKYGMGPRSC